jgi:hypothetical protein
MAVSIALLLVDGDGVALLVDGVGGGGRQERLVHLVGIDAVDLVADVVERRPGEVFTELAGGEAIAEGAVDLLADGAARGKRS